MDEALRQGARVRVSVADATRMNSQLITAALKRSRNNFEVRALSGSSTEVFLAMEDFLPHVALVSAQLEDGPLAGFTVLHRLRASHLKIPAVMLLDNSERDLVVDAFRAGARGIFCRGNDFDELPKCIRQIYQGQIWIGNPELEFLLELITNLKPFQVEDPARKPLLTPRERDVVRLVAEGMRNREIADQLGIGEHTVRNYIFRVFDKLGLSSRVELVLYALGGEDSSVGEPSGDLTAAMAGGK